MFLSKDGHVMKALSLRKMPMQYLKEENAVLFVQMASA